MNQLHSRYSMPFHSAGGIFLFAICCTLFGIMCVRWFLLWQNFRKYWECNWEGAPLKSTSCHFASFTTKCELCACRLKFPCPSGDSFAETFLFQRHALRSLYLNEEKKKKKSERAKNVVSFSSFHRCFMCLFSEPRSLFNIWIWSALVVL